MSALLLNRLPPEILSKVLSYLSKADLVRVSQVCKDLRHLCLEDPAWRNLEGELTNFRPDHFRHLKDANSGFQNHVSSKNSLKEACRIAHNWRHHRPKDYAVKKFRQKLLPWLCIHGNTLFSSLANNIHSCGVGPGRHNGADFKRRKVYRGHGKDIVRFAVTDHQVISGGRDKQILVWNKTAQEPVQAIPVDKPVISLDASSTAIVSGVRERGIVVLGKGEAGFTSRYLYSMKDMVWTVAINPNQRCFTSGSSCHEYRQPINVFDLERGTIITTCGRDYRYGAGVLALHYQDPFTFLSCGYDCSLNCWDLRDSCRIPAISFPDEDQSFSYSVHSDLDNFIACGLCRFGQVKFWDKRHRLRSLQSFYIGNVGQLGNSSPVYSLNVTATHLYAALSQSLQCLDYRSNLCQPPPR